MAYMFTELINMYVMSASKTSMFKSSSLLYCIFVLQIYTATNAKARELLSDHLVSEITMKWRIYFGPDKYSNADGLLRIIDDYR